MITVKDKIGFIQRTYEGDTPKFRFIVSKIKKVVIGKKKMSVYSDKFYALDAEELEDTTECIDTSKGLLIIEEPFILHDDEIDYYEAVCAEWNKNPPKSIFD